MRVFVPGQPFQPSPIFVGKARSQESGAPESLVRKFVNYVRKKFYNIKECVNKLLEGLIDLIILLLTIVFVLL